jgi:hypothetical protein
MAHVFPSNLEQLRAAREALDDTGVFIRSHLEMTVPIERQTVERVGSRHGMHYR